jgi:hypothetical protein
VSNNGSQPTSSKAKERPNTNFLHRRMPSKRRNVRPHEPQEKRVRERRKKKTSHLSNDVSLRSMKLRTYLFGKVFRGLGAVDHNVFLRHHRQSRRTRHFSSHTCPINLFVVFSARPFGATGSLPRALVRIRIRVCLAWRWMLFSWVIERQTTVVCSSAVVRLSSDLVHKEMFEDLFVHSTNRVLLHNLLGLRLGIGRVRSAWSRRTQYSSTKVPAPILGVG